MSESVSLTPGSDDWKKWRKLATQTIPGQRSALYFLNAKIRGLEDKIPMTYRAHLAMCLFAESATGIPEIDDARIRLVLVPRGVGKSGNLTQGLPILRTIRDPEYATGIANETASLAESFLGDIKAEFESNPILRILFPEIIPEDLKATTWKANRIITARKKKNPTSPTVLATGVGGTITGVHMNEWVCDDLLSMKAAEAAFRGSMSEIEATNRWITRLQPLLKSPKRDPMIFIGTRWWEGDSYEFIEDHWGQKEERREFLWTLNLPAQKFQWVDGTTTRMVDRPPETQIIKLYRRGEVAIFKFPAIDENGRPIFPERYNLDELAAMQEEDPVFYAGQYLLEPAAGAASVLDPNWLKTYDHDGTSILFDGSDGRKEYLPLDSLTTMISVDPAFSKKATSARTAIPVVGTDGKRLFLLEDFAARLDSEDDIAAKVVEFVLRYKPQHIFIETIVAQVAVANAIRRRFREEGLDEYIDRIEEIKSHGVQNKVMRIYGMEHYFKRGIFYYNPNMFKFFKEYIAFPRTLLRDILDALSFQVPRWEKIFSMTHHGRTHKPDPEKVKREEEAAIAKVREAWGPRRRRGKRR